MEVLIPDVVAHEALWASPLAAGMPEKVFGRNDPDVGIDDPNRSPDGRWATLDVLCPQGGDIRVTEETE